MPFSDFAPAVLGLRWASVDLSAGLVRVEAGRVALDGHRTATDDPKSAASWRTVPVEAMHSGTVALLRSLSARQAADRLAGRDGVRRQQRLRPGGRARPADPARGVQRQIRAAVPHGQCARDPHARREALGRFDAAPGGSGTGRCSRPSGAQCHRAFGDLRTRGPRSARRRPQQLSARCSQRPADLFPSAIRERSVRGKPKPDRIGRRATP